MDISGSDPVSLFGLHDKNIQILDRSFPEVKINARGNRVKVIGSSEEVDLVKNIIEGMIGVADRKGSVSENEVKTLITLKSGERKARTPLPKNIKEGDLILYTYDGIPVHAKTPGQKRIVTTSNQSDILFFNWAGRNRKNVHFCSSCCKSDEGTTSKKIILARPAVEAGESLGFLPGDLKEKIDPYLRPLYDALEDMIEPDKLDYYLTKNMIEIAPLAYMRGRTLNNAFVILDEAQNATNAQMKMFLTRIGFNSRAIITGDVTQTDLPRKQESGLITVQNILKDVDGIDFVYLSEEDVVRHKLVKDIINAYEKFES